MPNTREKLIEIMADINCNAEYCKDCEFANDIDGCVRRQKEIIADHLIANGVTLDNQVASTSKQLASSEWISVKDRLPKPFAKEPEWSETVLFRTITGRIYSGYRNQGRPQTSFYDDDWTPPYWLDESERIEVEDEYVTHWMPLPEPPKGE